MNPDSRTEFSVELSILLVVIIHLKLRSIMAKGPHKIIEFEFITYTDPSEYQY